MSKSPKSLSPNSLASLQNPGPRPQDDWNVIISGWNVEETGGLHHNLHKDIEAYVILQDFNKIMISPINLWRLIQDCDMSVREAIAHAILDEVYTQFLNQCEFEPSGAEHICITPNLS